MPSLSKKITLKALENVKDGQIIWDTELRGFGVRARGTGLYYVLKTRVHGHSVGSPLASMARLGRRIAPARRCLGCWGRLQTATTRRKSGKT